MRTLLTLTLGLLVACSGGGDARDPDQCDAIANDIRKAAAQRGIPTQGLCTSTDARVQKDFGDACRALQECEAHDGD